MNGRHTTHKLDPARLTTPTRPHVMTTWRKCESGNSIRMAVAFLVLASAHSDIPAVHSVSRHRSIANSWPIPRAFEPQTPYVSKFTKLLPVESSVGCGQHPAGYIRKCIHVHATPHRSSPPQTSIGIYVRTSASHTPWRQNETNLKHKCCTQSFCSNTQTYQQCARGEMRPRAHPPR